MRRNAAPKQSRLLALLLAFGMLVMLFSGCSSTGTGGGTPSESVPASEPGVSESAQQTGDGTVSEVTIGLEKDAGTLAPFAHVNFGNVEVFDGIYERLCIINADGSYTLNLMESVEEIDELTYHIKIHDNIYDSAGNHITAEDVAFSIDGYVNIGNNQGAVPDWESVSVVDEFTVEWKNITPFGNGMMYKEFSNPRIVSRKAYEESPNSMATEPIGTGPYKVTQYVAGSTLVLEKRDDYWNKDASNLPSTAMTNADKITYSIILDSAQMAMALKAGNIDFAGELNATDLISFENDPNYNIVEKPGVKPFLLLLNASELSPCQDINLRKAILNGVDNNAVVAAMTVEATALTSISNPGGADYLPEWNDRTEWTYDENLAKECLAQSSYAGEPLKLLCMSGAVPEACAMVIQSQLNDIGITVEIETVDNATYRSKSNDGTAYDILIMENGGGPYSTQCWNNSFSYTNGKTPINDPSLQEKLDAAIATGSEEDLRAFQDYVDEMAYGKGLVMPIYKSASTEKITSVFLHTDNNYLIGASTFSAG